MTSPFIMALAIIFGSIVAGLTLVTVRVYWKHPLLRHIGGLSISYMIFAWISIYRLIVQQTNIPIQIAYIIAYVIGMHGLWNILKRVQLVHLRQTQLDTLEKQVAALEKQTHLKDPTKEQPKD